MASLSVAHSPPLVSLVSATPFMVIRSKSSLALHTPKNTNLRLKLIHHRYEQHLFKPSLHLLMVYFKLAVSVYADGKPGF